MSTKKAVSKKAAAKSTKKTATKAAPVARVKHDYKAIAKSGKAESSGALIRARILEAKKDSAAIVAEVHAKFKGSTAKASDVSWNRGKLVKEGYKLPA